MNSTLTPVQGCLIKLDVNGQTRYGIVSQTKNEETCVVKWFDKDLKNQFSDVKLKDLQPALKNRNGSTGCYSRNWISTTR